MFLIKILRSATNHYNSIIYIYIEKNLESNEIMNYFWVIYLQIIFFTHQYDQRFYFERTEVFAFGIEFQNCAPSYINKFLILFVVVLVSKDRYKCLKGDNIFFSHSYTTIDL